MDPISSNQVESDVDSSLPLHQSRWYGRLYSELGYAMQRISTSGPIYVSDTISIIGCFALAAWLAPQGHVLWAQFAPMMACDLLVSLGIGLPHVIGTHPILEFRRMAMTAFVTFAIMSSAALYVRCPEILPAIATSQMLLIIALPCTRAVTRSIMVRQPWWGVRTVVCGCGDRLTSLFRDHFVSMRNGLRVVGFYEDNLNNDCPKDLRRYYLGPNDSAHRAPRCHHAYHAIVHRFGREDHELVRFSHQYLFNFRQIDFATDSLLLPAFWTSSSSIGATCEAELSRLSSRIIKRVFDITIAFTLLVMTTPLILILAVVVKLTSRGHAFTATKCVGKGGSVFNRYSLRSDSATISEIVSQPGDQAARSLGTILRRYRVDKLPQLWNVVKGEMSLVGPIPMGPEEIAASPELEELHLSSTRPGIFGVRQLVDNEQKRRIELDIFYRNRWSVWFDVYVIGLTAKRILFKAR